MVVGIPHRPPATRTYSLNSFEARRELRARESTNSRRSHNHSLEVRWH